MIEKQKTYLKFFTLSTAIITILFLAAVFIFIRLVEEIIFEKEVLFDNKVLNSISESMTSKKLTSIMSFITYFASALFLQVSYCVLILYFIFRKNYHTSIQVGIIGLGGFIITYFMKLAFHRLRPTNPLIEPLQNFSFPSGHATSAFIFYGLLSYLIWKSNFKLKYPAIILLLSFSILIGFSRIYLRLHFPSDVLAGFCIGFSWLIIIISVIEKLKYKQSIYKF